MLGRGLSLLKMFTGPSDELSLSALAKRAGLPKPTVYRLAGELTREGFIDPTAKGFRLGRQLFLLALRSSALAEIRSLALPYLAIAFGSTGATAMLAVRCQGQPLVVETISGRRSTPSPRVPGGRVLERSALGHALNGSSVPAGPETTGYVKRFDDLGKGVVSVAVPVFGASAAPIAALALSGRVSDRVIPLLRGLASRLSQDLARAATSSEHMWQCFEDLP
jgi:DNA-binding IclR family transcriptional regulator